MEATELVRLQFALLAAVRFLFAPLAPGRGPAAEVPLRFGPEGAR